MKILYVGTLHGTSTAIYYFSNMVRMGYSVVPYDPNFFNSRSWFDKYSIALTKSPPEANIKKSSQEIISICKQNCFDAVFVMSENFLSGSVIKEIKSLKPAPLFIYHSHDNNFFSGILKPKDFNETIKAYDYVFTTKSQNVKRYQDLGQQNAYFIPSAYEPSVHQPIPEKQSRWNKENLEVTFVGTYDKSRDTVFDTTGWQHLRVWGNDWKRSRHYNANAARILPHAIYFFELGDVLSHSKINLGLMRTEAEDLHTQRTFEIPACGGFQLAPRNSEMASFFKEDKEIVFFSDLEELKDKINFYLSHEEARAKIAEAGRERCLRDGHSYFDRVKTIFKTVGLEQRVIMKRGQAKPLEKDPTLPI